jgi:hypothetical protein
MNIAFIGNFSQKKGSKIFKNLVLKLNKKHKWYIFGYLGDTISYNKIKKYIKYSDSYNNGQLPILLKKHRIDLCLVLSIWPETYSKTFFEILDANIPLISFKVIGFPAHIFKNYPLFVDENINSIVDAISIVKNKESGIKKIISEFNQKNQKEFQKKKQLKTKTVDELLLG